MPWRRRYYRLLIHPRAQLKLFAPFFVFMLAWTAIFMVMGWVLHGMIDELTGPAATLTEDQIHKLQLLNTRLFKVFMIGAASSVAMAFGFWMGFSHSVFGPMIQIHRQIKRLASGQPGAEIKLRPKDEFQMVARDLNALTEALKNKAS